MSDALYLSFGITLVVLMVMWSKAVSRATFSPYAIYFIALFIHMFPDPMVRVYEKFGIPTNTWELMKPLNAFAFGAAFLGIVMGSFLFSARKSPRPYPASATFLNTSNRRIYYIVVIVLLICAFLAMLASGALGSSRAIYTGYGHVPLSFRLGKFITAYTISSVILLIALMVFSERPHWKTKLALVPPVLILIAMDTLTFGRQAVLTLLIATSIFTIARAKRFPVKAVALSVGMVFLIVAVASLRKFSTNISAISVGDILNLWSTSLGLFFVTIIPGQEVFSMVVGGFGSRSFELQLGETYFFNFISSMRLGFLLPQDYVPPSGWFASSFLSENSYGRDFSMLAEAYLNFGDAGMILFFFLGLLVAWLSRLIYRSKNLITVCWASYMIVNLIVGLRNDSLPIFTRAIFAFMPILLYAGLMNLLPRKSSSRSGMAR